MTIKTSIARVLKSRGQALLSDTRGAGLLEYLLLIGLIALAAIMGFQTFGNAVNTTAESFGGTVEGWANGN